MGLYFLVFGESLLNDGITIVLYNAMLALGGGKETTDGLQYGLAVLSFFTVVFGGLLIGILLGLILSFILKYTKHVRVIEPLLIFVVSYFSFVLAETIHWSGIICLIGCGITQKHYGFSNISKKSYTTVKYAVKTAAGFADCIIFLFLGIVTISTKPPHLWHTGFCLWTCVFCLLFRFIGVFLFSWLVNLGRIKVTHSHIILVKLYCDLTY